MFVFKLLAGSDPHLKYNQTRLYKDGKALANENGQFKRNNITFIKWRAHRKKSFLALFVFCHPRLGMFLPHEMH